MNPKHSSAHGVAEQVSPWLSPAQHRVGVALRALSCPHPEPSQGWVWGAQRAGSCLSVSPLSLEQLRAEPRPQGDGEEERCELPGGRTGLVKVLLVWICSSGTTWHPRSASSPLLTVSHLLQHHH